MNALTGTIWRESLVDLVNRWNRKHADQPNLNALQFPERVRTRSATVLKCANLKPATLLETPRQWQVGWDPIAAQERLSLALKRLDWEAVFQEEALRTPQAISTHNPQVTNAIIIDLPLADQLAARYKKAGLPLTFTRREAALQIMARELFEVAALKLGHRPPDPLLEEVAALHFVQQAFGWPFCPWALDLA